MSGLIPFDHPDNVKIRIQRFRSLCEVIMKYPVGAKAVVALESALSGLIPDEKVVEFFRRDNRIQAWTAASTAKELYEIAGKMRDSLVMTLGAETPPTVDPKHERACLCFMNTIFLTFGAGKKNLKALLEDFVAPEKTITAASLGLDAPEMPPPAEPVPPPPSVNPPLPGEPVLSTSIVPKTEPSDPIPPVRSRRIRPPPNSEELTGEPKRTTKRRKHTE